MNYKHALVSIGRKYANQIFAGDKPIELRRKYPQYCEGSTISFYTGGLNKWDGHIIGMATIKGIVRVRPAYLLKDYIPDLFDKACITGQWFDEYFKDEPEGIAIYIDTAVKFNKSLKISDYANKGVRPPIENYTYVRQTVINEWLLRLTL